MMDFKRYILIDRKPVVEPDLLTWAHWFEDFDNRKVASDVLEDRTHISTCFIGLNHQYGGGKPLLFETCVFGPTHSEVVERYATWEGAEGGHKRIVEKIIKEKKEVNKLSNQVSNEETDPPPAEEG